ncbi:MAG: 5-methyltetrahydropteroyltriglutamate--homocysteine S-methyltransferase [Anaerolineales bacterium]|nr:5-methyltetrahydropteroyltriglutamate--homocysteine S-methyltransferase [Anaerolineales bacterium]MCB0026578.1 5-methyltetrahydropteroyltriglutamate--homocysteine S-methyltransferase [Anaerolineales bacterium]
MLRTANLGYPRIGAHRELKFALERYWNGTSNVTSLKDTAHTLRQETWQLQHSLGLDILPSNDFSFYDQVLDTIAMVGAVPSRFEWKDEMVNLDTYFAMARGIQREGLDAHAMEMTKWFDTNYHYIVPEFEPEQTFRLASNKAVDEFKEAQQLGLHTRPVLLGPVSFLSLGKSTVTDFDSLTLLDRLLPVYTALLHQLANAGASWVQMDEPCLVLDLTDMQYEAYQITYAALATVPVNVMLTTYFGGLRDNLNLATCLPVSGLHLDLVRAPEQLEPALAMVPKTMVLSVGVVDGRNIWRTDLDKVLAQIRKAIAVLGEERVIVAPSSSLHFLPYDLELESNLDAELKSWLAFARQKVAEIVLLQQALSTESELITKQILVQQEALRSRAKAERTNRPIVKTRLKNLKPGMFKRSSPYSRRKTIQRQVFQLPPLPTTTIGSFPQTKEVRAKRSAFHKGKISLESYEAFLKEEIERTIRFQEVVGLDVLVHGESERTDMVEYFGKQLTGIAFTDNGWVQSYGSRCVRPPIIFGDVERPSPMTVTWSIFAQSLTDKPVKGMLTGPVTILQWSFVRDDQSRAQTCHQIALAIRDEVTDLEANGIHIIQIDEPALREGLPLRQADWQDYLDWAVGCFQLATSGVLNETQIHTHMCYAEFNDIIGAIEAMDADVISIENSRSNMELLNTFTQHHYPNDIGPGVYDIHSPRIPSQEEMETLLRQTLVVIDANQVWVNPDCGLKTRGWPEVEAALLNMVAAVRSVRKT